MIFAFLILPESDFFTRNFTIICIEGSEAQTHNRAKLCLEN